MKKIIIPAIAAICICCAIRYADMNFEKNSDRLIAQAFNHTDFKSTKINVEFKEEYEGEYLTRENARRLLKNIAKEMGIYDDISISENAQEHKGSVILEKSGENAKTRIELITMENPSGKNEIYTKQFLNLKLVIYEDIAQAFMWENELKNILKEYTLAPSGEICIMGEYQGKMSLNDKKQVSERILKETDTMEVISNKSDDNFIIYGFSEIFDDYRVIDGIKINMSLAMNYDEERNITTMLLSSPILNEEY